MTALAFQIRAPGKLLLTGEYAVLDGAPAVVAAVDRFLVARGERAEGVELAGLGERWSSRWEDGRLLGAAEAGALRFLALGADLAGADAVARGMTPAGFGLSAESALAADGRKLGLGSSAAAAVVGALAAWRAAGASFDRARLSRVALAAHRLAQGKQGSGADVAACATGGLILYTAPSEEALAGWLAAPDPGTLERACAGLDAAPLAPPPALRLGFALATVSVATPDRLARWRAFRAQDPEEHGRFVAEMAAASRALAAALQDGAAGAALGAIEAAGQALSRLERAAGFSVWTPQFRAAAQAVRAVGCALKPSGAGGGDAAVVVAFHPEALAAGLALCRGQGMRAERIDLAPGAEVSDEPSLELAQRLAARCDEPAVDRVEHSGPAAPSPGAAGREEREP